MRSLHVRFVSAVALALTLAACATPGGSSVTSVTIDGGDRAVVVDDALTLTATVVTEGGASSAVTWASSDEAVAVVDGAGSVTSFTAGATDLTATSTVDPSRSDTITLTVDPLGALVWTRQFGTSSGDVALGVAADATGNVYAAGHTRGALEGTNAGSNDAYLRSYDEHGTLRWTRQFGTNVDDLAYGVAADANGHVYVAGTTYGALEGPNAGGADAFVRSYDQHGTLRWTRQFGTDGDDIARGVATDASGNVYVVGDTGGALDGANAGALDAFVRSFDSAGDLRWTRQFGTTTFDTASGVATDASGNVYVAGYTNGVLGGSGSGPNDAFLRSYDGDGTVRWTRQFGTASDDIALGVATDASGNVYVAGRTQGALEGASAGDSDAFVRSYDGAGAVRWTRQFGTSDADIAFGVATDSTGTVYVTGYTFGALEGSGAGGGDAFLRSFDGDGTVRWTRQFGSASREEARGVATYADGGVYVAGYTLGALEGANAGGFDAFIRAYGR